MDILLVHILSAQSKDVHQIDLCIFLHSLPGPVKTSVEAYTVNKEKKDFLHCFE